jgi:uncharacterized phage protein (TIGR02218 family)
MKSLSAQLVNDITSDQFDKVTLLVVGLSTNIYRLTTDPVGLTFDGNWYTGTGIAFSRLSYSLDTDIDQLTLKLSNIDSTWSSAFSREDFIGREVTLSISSRTVAQSGGSDALILFQGYIDSGRFTPAEAEINVKSWLDFLNQPSPRRRFSSLCNYVLYDARCGVPGSSPANSYTGTATAGDSRHIYDAAGLTQADGYWDDGVLEVLSGDYYPAVRRIKSFAGYSVLLEYPLPGDSVTGIQYRVKRGCNKSFNACKTKFNNQLNFGGFQNIPLRQFI